MTAGSIHLSWMHSSVSSPLTAAVTGTGSGMATMTNWEDQSSIRRRTHLRLLKTLKLDLPLRYSRIQTGQGDLPSIFINNREHSGLVPSKRGRFLNQSCFIGIINPYVFCQDANRSMKPVALSVVTYDWENPHVCCKEERSGGVDSTARKASRPGEACLLEKWPAAIGQQRRCRHAAYRPDVFSLQCSDLQRCIFIYHPHIQFFDKASHSHCYFFFFFCTNICSVKYDSLLPERSIPTHDKYPYRSRSVICWSLGPWHINGS